MRKLLFLVLTSVIITFVESAAQKDNVSSDVQGINKIKKWWTEKDLEAIQSENTGLVLNKFNFIRSSLTQAPMFIGTGEMGGFIDGLGSNTNFYAKQMSHSTELKLGFQTYDMFNAAYPWNAPKAEWEKNKKDYSIVNSRTYNLRFIVQPLINNAFDTALISNYSQIESLWNAEVVTEFVYDDSVQLTIQSVASWVNPRLVFFKVIAKNKGSNPIRFSVNRTISDSLTASMLTGKLNIVHVKQNLQVGIIDAYYSRIKSVCNKNNDDFLLNPGQTAEDYSYFSITTENTELDAENIVNAAITDGFDKLREEHIKFAHDRWNSSMIFIPDWNLQRIYLQAIYCSFGNVAGKYYPMGASYLGGAGWSGASYAYDGSFALSVLLRTGNFERVKGILDKMADDILNSKTKFINFAFDENCTEGCGRYSNELHETSVFLFPIYLMLQYGRMNNDLDFITNKVYPVMKQMSLFLMGSMIMKDGFYSKDTEYAFNDQTFILRSIESDRMRQWFTDLAISYKDLLLKTIEVGKIIVNDKDIETLDKLYNCAQKIYIPQTPLYYQMFANDNFPETPKDGWGGCRWNFHNASVGAYPSTILLGDEKLERTLKYIYEEGKKETHLWGSYSMISYLASLRLRMLQFTETSFYDPDWQYYLKKVDASTGNSLSDNDNFLMALTILATICQEFMIDIHDDVIRPFSGLIPSYKKQGAFFKNLYTLNGSRISGYYDENNGWIKIENPVSQTINVEIPVSWNGFKLIDDKNQPIEYDLNTINSRANCKPVKSRIITFNGQGNEVYFINRD
jgi:hypothetical protein